MSLLNKEQEIAVQATEGRVLVLAGAGSGKTRVIAFRIAHLVGMGKSPESILGLTFTNKAAAEMPDHPPLPTIHDVARAVAPETFGQFDALSMRRDIAAQQKATASHP